MVDQTTAKAAAYFAAGICMGLGSIGPSLGQGLVGAKAIEAIGKNPESAPRMFTSTLMPLLFIESSAIYAFLISMFLIFMT